VYSDLETKDFRKPASSIPELLDKVKALRPCFRALNAYSGMVNPIGQPIIKVLKLFGVTGH
jgi:hypothetical protein